MVAHENGADNTFLPGGHIERGEKAVDALVREIREEIGISPIVGQHIGAIEHTWRIGSEAHHKLNLVFRTELPKIDSMINLASSEKHLEFFWVEIGDIGNHHLLPAPMNDLVSDKFGELNPFWASTIDE